MSKLELQKIKKDYPEFSLDLNLSVNEGEFLTIIGPSGSGKSTLLNIIAGLDSPAHGSILLDGRDITSAPPQKRGISMVFQDYALFPSMNVEKNIAWAMKIRKVKASERHSAAAQLLSLVNLSGYGKRKVTTLSGGEAQRVALARALSSDPSILLLDEPLSALDANLRRRLRDEIRRIHDSSPSLTTVYVTHDREEAFAISDRIAIIKGGRLEMADTPENIYRNPATLFCAYFTGEGTALSADLFNLSIPADTIFFRPEDVLVKEEPFFADSDSYIILDECEVISSEYLGRCYILGLNYKGHRILAESSVFPQKRHVSIYISKNRLLFFKDGVNIS